MTRPVDRNPEGEDRNGLRAEHESDGALQAQAPNTLEHAFKSGASIGIELGKRDSSQSQGETYEQAKCDAWLAYEATVSQDKGGEQCFGCEGAGRSGNGPCPICQVDPPLGLVDRNAVLEEAAAIAESCFGNKPGTWHRLAREFIAKAIRSIKSPHGGPSNG